MARARGAYLLTTPYNVCSFCRRLERRKMVGNRSLRIQSAGQGKDMRVTRRKSRDVLGIVVDHDKVSIQHMGGMPTKMPLKQLKQPLLSNFVVVTDTTNASRLARMLHKQSDLKCLA
jgi:hypothetical protein